MSFIPFLIIRRKATPKQAKDFTKILHRGKTAITIVVYDKYRLRSWSMSQAGGGPGQSSQPTSAKQTKRR
jgi:hypothetical protein